MDIYKPTYFKGLFQQLSQPTAVSHSIFCNCLHPRRKNLVLARGNVLEVYDIRGDSDHGHFIYIIGLDLYEEIQAISSVRFCGDLLDSLLLSFKEAKISALTFDIQTMGFKTCSLHTYEQPLLKAGRLQFTKSPTLTVDPLQRCAVMIVYDRYLAVFPFRRVDALISSQPSNGQIISPLVSNSWSSKATAPILPTFTTLLSTSTGEPINHVIDIQFLYGFYEPTLLVLYEPTGTWAGRVTARRDTCCIVALSLNLREKTNPVIWFQELLPYDCHTVVPIPMPIGGVIIIAVNSILYLKQTLPSRGIPLNCYANASTNFPFRQDLPTCGPLALDNCRACLLSTSEILIVDRDGTFYILTLILEKANSTVTNLHLAKVGSYLPAETITRLNDNKVFVGSFLADSLLLSYEKSPVLLQESEPLVVKSHGTDMDHGSENGEPEAKKAKPLAEHVAEPMNEVDSIDEYLYGPTTLTTSSNFLDVNKYSFKTLDSLLNLGPISSITPGEVPCLATGQTDPTDETLTLAQAEMAHTELIVCTARPSFGCRSGLLQLHRSVRARGLTAFELPEYSSLWSLYGPPVSNSGNEGAGGKPREEEKRNHTEQQQGVNPLLEEELKQQEVVEDLVVESAEAGKTEKSEKGEDRRESATPLQDEEDPENVVGGDGNQKIPDEAEAASSADHGKEGVSGSPEAVTPKKPRSTGPSHSYLLLTREDSSMILEVSSQVVELEVSGFETSETTVLAANLGVEIMRRRKKQRPEGEEHEDSDTPDPELASENEENDPKVGVDYPYIIQVCPNSIRLLDGPCLLEKVVLTHESRICLARVADPYVLVGTEDDDLILIKLRDRDSLETPGLGSAEDQLTDSHYLKITRPKVTQIAPPICFFLYHDESCRLAQWLSRNVNLDLVCPISKGGIVRYCDNNGDDFATGLSAGDEEDILLYGQVIDIVKREVAGSGKKSHAVNSRSPSDIAMGEPGFEDLSTSHFAFIVFSNGVLEIYSVPGFRCMYEVQGFNELPNILVDSLHVSEEKDSNVNGQTIDTEDLPSAIHEIAVFSIDTEHRRPALFVRTEREVVCYEALCGAAEEAVPLAPVPLEERAAGAGYTRCPLRWRRLTLACPLLTPSRLCSDPRLADIQTKLQAKPNAMQLFDGIGGHRGVFVGGPYPVWMFCSRDGRIHVFPHTIDGVITSFAPLNIPSCPEGFVYLTHSNEMKLATLQPGYSYEHEFGIGSIPIKGSPRFVQYHIQSKTYVVITSSEVECQTIVRLSSDGNKEEERVSRPLTCVFPRIDAFRLQVLACLTPPASPHVSNDPPQFEVVPNSTFDFEPFEAVSCLATVQLSSDLTVDETKDYLALGANLSYGEEIPVRGRIILIDIIEVVPEPGKPLTRHKVKTVYDADQKGPVTSLASCQGYLVSAVGQKIYIWALSGGELEGVAFVDTDLYIHGLHCAHNLILAADVLKSVQVLRFQSQMRVLSLVSRDHPSSAANSTREVFTTNFFVDGAKLGFFVTDREGNLLVYSYDPEEPASCAGRLLVRRADMRMPGVATACLRVGNSFRHPLLTLRPIQAELANIRRRAKQVFLKPPVGANLLTTLEYERARHSVYFGTRNGALYLITPAREKMANRMKIVEKNLVQYVGCMAGLIPHDCRKYNQNMPELANVCGNFVDGDLIHRYLTLPHELRVEVAKKSGQSMDSIMDDIAEMDCVTLHF